MSSSSDCDSTSSLDETNPRPLHQHFNSISLQHSSDVTQSSSSQQCHQTEEKETLNGDHEVEEKKIDGDVSGSSAFRTANSELEIDGPSSPTSSGYAGEIGSSDASRIGVVSEDDEIESLKIDVADLGGFSSSSGWVACKRHVNEDDASISWRKRKKHFFILSHSGKPIYSRYGDEHKLAGFSATLQAIISFVENGGDRVKLVRAGKHQVVFLIKGPIYLVCISCTEEPYESLRGQLELIYGQMIVILTKSVNRCFEKNPKFDMTPLLGGTDVVFSSLIHSFNWFAAIAYL